MEFKHLSLEWKADDEGTVEGYGSVFDVTDNGNDIVAAGAFTRSLQSGRKVKMLFQHDPSQPIGVWDEMAEDGNGLRVKGRILKSINAGREAYELAKAGALDGLSIGYRTVKSMGRNGKRVIMQADLWEVSLVTFPMNEMARIDAVKAAEMPRDEIERLLTLRAGLSRSVARKLLADGYEGIKDMRGAVDGADELAQLLMARAAL